jgi:NAD+ synthase (glutamine-hydrolysing)
MAGSFWLWDHLRRSGARGFFLPLSGGADSAATATIVYNLADQIYKKIEIGNKKVL